MENIQIIVYIVFGIIYLIFKGLQKKAAQKNRSPMEGDLVDESKADYQQPRPRPQPKTFEELLREFSGEAEEATEKVKPRVEEVVQQAKRSVVQPEKTREVRRYEQPREARSYEQPVVEGRRLETLDQRVSLSSIQKERERTFITTENLDEKSSSDANQYTSMLRTLDGAKKAFVMTEIFNRKY